MGQAGPASAGLVPNGFEPRVEGLNEHTLIWCSVKGYEVCSEAKRGLAQNRERVRSREGEGEAAQSVYLKSMFVKVVYLEKLLVNLSLLEETGGSCLAVFHANGKD
ncbi:unnamed protein product [Prunus armeniaca]|uniref:Uncharacterized protein n=1 Tax=Prunus armeniaca TaxID=36596 RepID=A0A6J5X0I2_PRUAR|nr:unnamed protein product [Prunus armeniaca]